MPLLVKKEARMVMPLVKPMVMPVVMPVVVPVVVPLKVPLVLVAVPEVVTLGTEISTCKHE